MFHTWSIIYCQNSIHYAWYNRHKIQDTETCLGTRMENTNALTTRATHHNPYTPSSSTTDTQHLVRHLRHLEERPHCLHASGPDIETALQRLHALGRRIRSMARPTIQLVALDTSGILTGREVAQPVPRQMHSHTTRLSGPDADTRHGATRVDSHAVDAAADGADA